MQPSTGPNSRIMLKRHCGAQQPFRTELPQRVVALKRQHHSGKCRREHDDKCRPIADEVELFDDLMERNGGRANQANDDSMNISMRPISAT